jgi:carbon-monoxide dehydrogenase medium subunit/6-hydroxypseudooxynicotine dehydrogenase subunit alpha
MKPPPFHYVRCSSAADAAALLSEGGEDAKLLAGGQSLVPLLNFRLARPSLLVDINRIANLDYVHEGVAAELCIGALTRQATLEMTSLPSCWDAIAEALPLIGHYPTRLRGTVGGSIAHADPSAELPVLCLGFGAKLTLVGPRRQRVVVADDFFLGPFMTLIQPDEVLTEVCLMSPPLDASTAFEEFSERHGDFALVSVFAGMQLTGGICTWVRIAAGGVGPTPIRALAAESVLAGSRAGDADLREAAAAVAAECSAADDLHCSAKTRQEITNELALRALASARAKQQVAPEGHPDSPRQPHSESSTEEET